jgi:biopolymer transport protein TolR
VIGRNQVRTVDLDLVIVLCPGGNDCDDGQEDSEDDQRGNREPSIDACLPSGNPGTAIDSLMMHGLKQKGASVSARSDFKVELPRQLGCPIFSDTRAREEQISMAFSMAGGPSDPQINVTPLIDVLLVLIIVFMVVQSMTTTKGLEAQIPQAAQDDKSQPVPVDRTIVIQVVWGARDQPPALKINQETVKWEDLQSRLHNIFKIRAERIAFVRGDDDIDFEYVADIIDIARNAGVNRVGLLTKAQ